MKARGIAKRGIKIFEYLNAGIIAVNAIVNAKIKTTKNQILIKIAALNFVSNKRIKIAKTKEISKEGKNFVQEKKSEKEFISH